MLRIEIWRSITADCNSIELSRTASVTFDFRMSDVRSLIVLTDDKAVAISAYMILTLAKFVDVRIRACYLTRRKKTLRAAKPFERSVKI